MQIHTKQFFNGGIDKEFEKLEDEINAKFLEYIKLYSTFWFLIKLTMFHILLYFYSYNRHKSRLLYKHNKVNKKFS